MSNFGIFKGFSDKLFEGELPTNLGMIGSINYAPTLLDLYPNATAAYSLRKLRSAYTGSAIRVRRSSDNTEQDIGFSGSGGLDTSSLTSFCGSGNGFVTTWYDQSGNARNATQSTAGNQPQIVNNGTIYFLNGKPAIFFNNSGSVNTIRLITGTQLSLFNVGSIYSVNSYIDGNSFRVVYSNGYQASAGIWAGIVATSSRQLQLWTSNQQLQGNTGSFSFNTQILQSYFFESGANNGNKIYINNILDVQATKTYTIATPLTQGAIGRDELNESFALYGSMNEIVFYGEKTNINNSGINTNINSYYGIY